MGQIAYGTGRRDHFDDDFTVPSRRYRQSRPVKKPFKPMFFFHTSCVFPFKVPGMPSSPRWVKVLQQYLVRSSNGHAVANTARCARRCEGGVFACLLRSSSHTYLSSCIRRYVSIVRISPKHLLRAYHTTIPKQKTPSE